MKISFATRHVAVASVLLHACVTLPGCGLTDCVPIDDQPWFETDGVLVIAHRGGAGLWPENTLFAFHEAVALGVDVLEMDLHETRDGELVVIHDATLAQHDDGPIVHRMMKHRPREDQTIE